MITFAGNISKKKKKKFQKQFSDIVLYFLFAINQNIILKVICLRKVSKIFGVFSSGNWMLGWMIGLCRSRDQRSS